MSILEKRYQSYLHSGNSFGRAQVNIFLSLLDDSYSRILEVGCGKGFFTYLLLRGKRVLHDKIFGVDVFDSCQKNDLKRLANSFEFREIVAGQNLPFFKNKFDLVFSMDVLEHVDNWQKFILEQIRVTRNGGKILIGTPNRLRLSNLLLTLFGKLSFPRSLGHDDYGEVIHIHEFVKEELLGYLGSLNGVKNIKAIPCWLGSNFFSIGYIRPKGILSNFCQFWFIEFNKT